jgi:erythromycin esterase-like protein
VRQVARPLTGAASDYDVIVELGRQTRFALLGEASHGTHEFYRERAEITKRLMTEQAFTAVAVEADWPDAARVTQAFFPHGKSLRQVLVRVSNAVDQFE